MSTVTDPTRVAQESIRQVVRSRPGGLRGLTPRALVASLLAAAVAPVCLGPLLAGTGVVGAVSALGTLVAGLGTSHLSSCLEGCLKRIKGRSSHLSESELRKELESDLVASMGAQGAEAAALRQELSQFLRSVDGIETALTAARDDIKQTMAEMFADVGEELEEFRWILEDTRHILHDIRSDQAVALAAQRAQLDLLRSQAADISTILDRLSGPMVDVTRLEREPRPQGTAPNPYKGLVAFEPEDADVFFGRERLVAELLARLDEGGLLALVGPSGSGKSSLLRAGLMARLLRDPAPATGWSTVPSTAGRRPLEELAVQMAALSGVLPSEPLYQLELDHRALALSIKQVLAGEPSGTQVLVAVDQFEEIFVQAGNEAERTSFIEALVHASRETQGRAIVVVAMRADFYGRCAQYPALATELQDHQVLVGPMTEEELRRAIEGPAERVGLYIEPGLTERILRDVGGQPGALPLLSHALFETWKHGEGTLTLDAYQASGGVAGAIARTAEDLFAAAPHEERVAIRRIFLRLVEPGEGMEDTRRRALRSELATGPEDTAILETVLEKLADARLVITGKETVEVAHEALIREWPTLRGWIEEDRLGLRVRLHLTEATEEWLALDRDPGALYRGARLGTATEWAEQHGGDLNPAEAEFLAASQTAHRSELESTRRRNRVLRRLSVGLAAVLVIAVVSASVAVRQARLASAREGRARLASALQLVTAASVARQQRLDLSLLLSLEAGRSANIPASARASLLSGLQYSPRIERFLHGDHADLGPSLFVPEDVAAGPLAGHLITGDEHGAVIAWDTEARTSTMLIEQGPVVRSLALAADHRTLLVGREESITWIDLPTGREIDSVPQAGKQVIVVPDPSSDRFAATTPDGNIQLWDVDTRKPEGGPFLSTEPGLCPTVAPRCLFVTVAFSPDGNEMAAGTSAGTIVRWNTTTREQIGDPLVLGTQGVSSIAYSPLPGEVLAGGSQDGTLQAWPLAADLRVPRLLNGHSQKVTSLAFNEDGSLLASASQDGTIRLWNMDLFRQAGDPIVGSNLAVRSVAMAPDGQTIASAGVGGNLILWNIASPNSLEQPILTELTEAVVYVNGGLTIAAASGEEIILSNAETGVRGLSLQGHTKPVLALASDSVGNLLASGSDDGSIFLWDLSAQPPRRTPLVEGDHDPSILTLALSSDGSRLVSGARDGAIEVWDGLGAGAPVPRELQPGDQNVTGHAVYAVALDPSGRWLAVGLEEGLVELWDVATGALIDQLQVGGQAAVTSVAFNRDGTLLAAGADDRTVRLFQLPSLSPMGSPLEAHNPVKAVAFSPNGSFLASGGNDNAVTLWDVASRTPVGQLQEDFAIVDLAFSPDGGRLAVGTVIKQEEGGFSTWNVDPASWDALACEIAGRNLSGTEWREYLPDRSYEITCPQWPSGED
jgi:WD40 repeat protein/energy-coupling factor transporter ATP-binding protein EcfA2